MKATIATRHVLIILIDATGSTAACDGHGISILERELQAAQAVVRAAPANVDIALATFGTHAAEAGVLRELVAQPTSDRNVVLRALGKKAGHAPAGHVPLFQATAWSSRLIAELPPDVEHTVLLFTDSIGDLLLTGSLGDARMKDAHVRMVCLGKCAKKSAAQYNSNDWGPNVQAIGVESTSYKDLPVLAVGFAFGGVPGVPCVTTALPGVVNMGSVDMAHGSADILCDGGQFWFVIHGIQTRRGPYTDATDAAVAAIHAIHAMGDAPCPS